MSRSFKEPMTKPCDHRLDEEWYAPEWIRALGGGWTLVLGAPTLAIERDKQACSYMFKFDMLRPTAIHDKQDIYFSMFQ
jgi:hypothetical protein